MSERIRQVFCVVTLPHHAVRLSRDIPASAALLGEVADTVRR
ncbi:hypothetical protein [Streptomyces paludis]|nr:hypothetical protein [Streptomyces paludis]